MENSTECCRKQISLFTILSFFVLCTQRGAQSQNPKVKSCTLLKLHQPGALAHISS